MEISTTSRVHMGGFYQSAHVTDTDRCNPRVGTMLKGLRRQRISFGFYLRFIEADFEAILRKQ